MGHEVEILELARRGDEQAISASGELSSGYGDSMSAGLTPCEIGFVCQELAQREMGSDFAKCVGLDSRGSMFAQTEQVMRTRLRAAYPVLLWLIKDSERSLEQLLRLSVFDNRKREIPRSKLPLIAMCAAAKPRNQRERNTCSGLAGILHLAISLRIKLSDFADWLNHKPLNDLKDEGRRRRKEGLTAALDSERRAGASRSETAAVQYDVTLLARQVGQRTQSRTWRISLGCAAEEKLVRFLDDHLTVGTATRSPEL